MGFKEIQPSELELKPFYALDKEWALVSAGREDSMNTMTVSWGSMGTIWGKPTVTAYIRDSRYTKGFVDKEDIFTLSFFDEEYKKTLGYLGAASGRDEDKVAKSGLTPTFEYGINAPVFKEAKLTFICRKVFAQRLELENVLNDSVFDRYYPDGDRHTIYFGEVVKVLVK